MVRDSLNETNDKKEKKETLVEHLDLSEDAEQTKITEPEAEDEGKVVIEAEEVKEPAEKKWDLTLLDNLINDFLATIDDNMLPVLCGYFLKIMQTLIAKERKRMYEYLFNKRQGDIFDGLKKHLAHHSVAMLIVELF